MKKKKNVFILCASECSKKGPMFWGYMEEENPKPLAFTVCADFYETLLNECEGDYMMADFKAIGYALRVKGYNTKNLVIQTKEGVIYE